MSKEFKKDTAQDLFAFPMAEHIAKVSWNVNALDELVGNLGIEFDHFVAIPNVLGQTDKGDYRHVKGEDFQSSNGYIYKKVGSFTGVVISNSKYTKSMSGGLFDFSQAQLVMPRRYNKGKEFCAGDRIYFAPGDRVIYKDKKLDINVVHFEKIQTTRTGIDRLQYPAKSVEFIIDNAGVSYKQGKEFKIDDQGYIVWKGQTQPGIDPDTGKGRIYGIRYRYGAFFYVKDLLHEVRMTQQTDPATLERTFERCPYSVLIQREYMFFNKQVDPNSTEADKEEREGLKPKKFIDLDIQN